MPTKKGAGGRQQNYNPRTGRYVKTDYLSLFTKPQLSKKEKARQREKERREFLFNRAKNSRDEYLFDVYCEIEKAFPGTVLHVNEKRFDPFINSPREFDIITKKCIIEVKSGQRGRKLLKQFLSQKKCAEKYNKTHIVIAPQMPTMAIFNFKQHGIKIVKDHLSLINLMKEYEK